MEDERITFLRELAVLCKRYQVGIEGTTGSSEVKVHRSHEVEAP